MTQTTGPDTHASWDTLGARDSMDALLVAAGILTWGDVPGDPGVKLAAAAGLTRALRRPPRAAKPGPVSRPANTTSAQITPRTNPASYHLTPRADGTLPSKAPGQGLIPAPKNPAAKPAQAPMGSGRGSWTS